MKTLSGSIGSKIKLEAHNYSFGRPVLPRVFQNENYYRRCDARKRALVILI